MDKLKKRIFITLLLLLFTGMGGLCLLLTHVLRQHESPAEAPAQKITETEQKQISAKPATQTTADIPPSNDSTSAQLDEEALTRLELEELKPFFQDESHLKTVWGLNKNAFTRRSAYAAGMNYFTQQLAKGEISQQELTRKIQSYKETLDRMWRRRLDNIPQEVPMPEPITPDADDEWTEGPCEGAVFPAGNLQSFTCRTGAKGFCAFFENGAPYFCQTKDGKTAYQLNKWGSSVTVTQKTPSGMILAERYYADGKLARATDYDNEQNSTTLQFDGGNALRLTKKDKSGKVLDKYYFFPKKAYVHYPDGNDMGETNGPWMVQNGLLFIDGKPFYKLPAQKLAPDVCMIFNGYCPLQKIPYSKNELPSPQMMPEKL